MKTTNKELKNKILKYPINKIDEAYRSLVWATDWEYFDDEIKTLNNNDLKELLEELQGGIKK